MRSLLILFCVFSTIFATCFDNPSFSRRVVRSEEDDSDDDCFSSETVFHNLMNVHQRLLGGLDQDLDNTDPNQNRKKQVSTSEGSESFLQRSLNRFTNFMKPWWQGPNVCVDIQEKVEPVEKESIFVQSFISYSKSCRDTGKSHICTEKTSKNDSDLVTKIVEYHCCLGYERERGQRGCTKKIELVNMEDLLKKLNLTKFLDAARSAGILERIKTENLTLFVPLNEAFDASTPSDEINIVTDGKKDQIQYVRDTLLAHIVPGWKSIDSMEDESSLNALQNSAIRTSFYTVPKPMVTVNCAKVTLFDQQALNGFVQIIDRLMPQATRTLWRQIRDDAQLSVFASIIDEPIRQLLDDPKSHVTIFAFSDESFGKLPKLTQDRIRSNHSCMRDVIKNHIVPYTICMSIIRRKSQINSMNRYTLDLNVTSLDGAGVPLKFSVNGKTLIAQDRVASNGVLHLIDGPLLFPKNQEPLDALKTYGFTKLSDALNIDLVRQFFETSNETTIFIPSGISKILNMTDLDARQKLLLNHVARRVNKNEFETAAGLKLKYRVEPSYRAPFSLGKTLIQCSIPAADIYISCGALIRYIDKPLNVPVSTVMDVFRKNAQLSIFSMFLEASGIDAELRNRGDIKKQKIYTIFPPSNEALEKYLPGEKRTELLQNNVELKKFVRRHIVEKSYCCNQLGNQDFMTSGVRLETHNNVTYTSSGDWHLGTLRVGGARVLDCDLVAQNGLVHPVDRPLAERRRSSFSLIDDDNIFDTLFKAFEF